MRCSLLMNGCGTNFEREAAALRGFARNLGPEFAPDTSIVLCQNFAEREFFAARAIGPKLVLVAIGGYQPERALNALKDVCRDDELLILPGDFFGAETAVRLAARLGGSSLTGLTRLRLEGARPVCEKKVYAQKMTAAFGIEKLPLCLSLAKGGPEEAKSDDQPLEIVELDRRSEPGGEHLVSASLTAPPRERGLEESDFVLAGGRGLGGPEGVLKIKRLAKTLGADWGVSRPAAMSGWAPLERMIGVSGAMTRPELCLCLGASGAAAFYAGVARARTIIAVNSDPKAPIIAGSDAAAVEDCLAVLAELTALAEKGEESA